VDKLNNTETMAITRTTALIFRVETDLQAAFILANAANVLTGSLLAMARFDMSPSLA
jgi:hypothetical protein